MTDGASGMSMMDETGCDFVMVGRGALGNPWIFRELNAAWKGTEPPAAPSMEDKKQMMIRHFRDVLALKGEYAAGSRDAKACRLVSEGPAGLGSFSRHGKSDYKGAGTRKRHKKSWMQIA